MVDHIYDDVNNKIKYKNQSSKENRIMEYLGIDKKEDFKKYIVYDYTFPRLVYRKVASNTNERTLISAILTPYTAIGESLYLSYPKNTVYIMKKYQ
ncbi:hypothetical protein [Brachyspira hyodysenteriae]|uniref:hypothetical protein n=1 Tax=Brachyspira hyodysenteriae TaxID=159 RepID=UPI0022CD5F7A|nr:hypothetical protein [Brachyspira hyodysenteriae]MCZ9939708.1 hypothetical protein [Brachyspira hyodysenteriae]MDA0055339.1 hypothetical protein [Brachyspira hyodysenteriae]